MNHLFQRDLSVMGDWTLALVVLGLWLVLGFILLRGFFSVLNKAVSGTSHFFDNMILKGLPLPAYLIWIIGGVMFASRFAPVLAEDEAFMIKVLKIVLMVALVYLADNLLQGLLKDLENRHGDLKHSHLLFSALVRVGVWSLGILVVLASLGINITPLLASLGVGSLAVALALQSTLANLFSGMYLLVDKPIRVGHYIKLPTGEQGGVESIGWRSTRVRLIDTTTLVIPNSKLAEERILNYHLPNDLCSFFVELGVDYDSDLEKVERVTLETARSVQKNVRDADPNFEPAVSFHSFADSSINLNVLLSARQYPSTILLRHAFIKAIHARYREEGITIPFPQRTVEIKETTKGRGSPPRSSKKA